MKTEYSFDNETWYDAPDGKAFVPGIGEILLRMTNETTASQTKVAAPDENHMDAMRELVSDFRKAAFEFGQGGNPDDHSLMMRLQQQLFVELRVVASQPKSIGDDAQFHALMSHHNYAQKNGDFDQRFTARKNLVTYIDNFRAPAAQASATIQAAPDDDALIVEAVTNAKVWCVHPTAETTRDIGRAVLAAERNKPVPQTRRTIAEISALLESSKDDLRLSFCAKEMREMLCAYSSANANFNKLRNRAATIQEPVMVAEPVCETCGGSGQMCVGLSYQESDGNGPVMEPCAECGYGDAASMVADPAGVAEENGLNHLEQLARAATQGQWEYGYTTVETQQEAIDICRDNISATAKPIDKFYEVFLMNGLRTALIGNGPTSAANAEYIASLHPANILHLISLARRSATVKAVPSEALDDEQAYDQSAYRHFMTFEHFKAFRAECRAAPLAYKTGGGE